jgi:hypothetical protein
VGPSPWTADEDGARRGTPQTELSLDTGDRFIEVNIMPPSRSFSQGGNVLGQMIAANASVEAALFT